MAADAVARIMWRRVDSTGLEVCELTRGQDVHSLHGLVLLRSGRNPCTLEYWIDCNEGWETRKVRIRGSVGSRDVDLRLKVDRQKRWFLDGKRQHQVDGCLDVDLGFSPSTNVLPIRRLRLKPGARREVTACWVEFPSLAVRPLPQVYEKKDRRTVHYESRGGRFHRDLEVASNGMVISYPGLWEAC